MLNKLTVAVSYTTPEKLSAAENFAQQNNLPLINFSEQNDTYSFLLVFTEQHLELRQTKDKQLPVFIDFLQGNIHQRLQRNTGKELLKKALGIKANYIPRVLDATAGLGQDAMLMASFGCEVTMLERSPIIYALLEDGLQRFFEATNRRFIITLLTANAIDYLQQLENHSAPDIIYLDPMYPHSNKTTLAKKKMRWLRTLVGEDSDANVLLEIALKKALKRVIVKRPRLAKPLNDHAPDFALTGRSQRFDVYVIKQ